MTSSYAAAMELTSLHESAISVPPWSALHPPREGITSPAAARNEAMSERYRPPATVWLFTPFQASVQELLLSVSRNASVKYESPEAFAVAAIPSLVQVSKYGANTWFGSGDAAEAIDGPESVSATRTAEAHPSERWSRARDRRRMSSLLGGVSPR